MVGFVVVAAKIPSVIVFSLVFSPMRRHWRNSDRLATSLACKILWMLGICPRFSVVLTRIHEADVL